MTPLQARNEILAIFKAAWDTTGYTALYPDVGGIPPDNAPWARVTLRHVTGEQASLASAASIKKWTQEGILTVQVFAPQGDGMTKVYQLSNTVLNAYRDATDGSVWYRNHRIKEAGGSGAFEQVNVTVEFSYDETR